MDDETKELRKCFGRVFSTRDGKTMLWWIADQCGFFAERGEEVKPELTAFLNRLLRMGGITSPSNAGRLMDALMDVSMNMEDKDVY